MSNASTSCPDNPRLRDFLAGRLTVPEMDSLVAHFEGCETCQLRLAQLDDSEASVDSWVGHGGEIPYANETQCAEAVDNASTSRQPAKPQSLPTKPPERLGEYELLEPLGEGGMGAVYRARNTSLESICAIKLLLPNRRSDRTTIERFEREMVALGKLDHPNIVRAIDAGEDQGIHYLAMEFVRGVDFSRILRLRKQLPIAEACEAARQAALGLDYVHRHGRVHRDVKPSNLMLRADGVVKLLDLGLAHVEEFEIDESTGSSEDLLEAANLELTRSHQIMGTIEYMAPEQASDTKSVDHRADIYSLGCTLYKLIAGQSPFATTGEVSQLSQVLAHVQTPAPPLKDFRLDIPPPLAKVIEEMLEKAPEDRPQSAERVAAALEPFCEGADLVDLLRTPETAKKTSHIPVATAVHRSDDMTPDEKPFPWGATIATAAALLLALFGVGAYSLWGGNSGTDVGWVEIVTDSFDTENQLALAPIKISEAGTGTDYHLKGGPPKEVHPGDYEVRITSNANLKVTPEKFRIDPGATVRLTVSGSGGGFSVPEPIVPSGVAEAGPPVELLTLLDLDRDTQTDDWALSNQALACRGGETASSVQFPCIPPERYRFEATIKRNEGDESLCLVLPNGSAPIHLILDGWPNQGYRSGIYSIGGNTPFRQNRSYVARGQQLRSNVATDVAVTVYQGDDQVSVSVEVDSATILSWRGKSSQLGPCRWMDITSPSVVSIGRFNSSFEFSELKITPLRGEAERIEFASPSEDSLLAASQRAIWKGGDATIRYRSAPSKAVQATGTTWLAKDDEIIAVEAVDLQGNLRIDDSDLAYFSNLESLETLRLSETNISSAGLHNLGSLPALRRIFLSRTKISDTEFTERAFALFSSSKLVVADLASTDVGTPTIQAIAKCPNITDLDLSDTRVETADLGLLAGLDNLSSLSLDRSQLQNDDIDQLPTLPQLKTLTLNDTAIDSLKGLTTERYPGLSKLEFKNTDIDPGDVEQIRQMFPDLDIVSGFEKIELLELIDPRHDALTGTWTTQDGRLMVYGANPARLAVPVELPEEFDLKAVARRSYGANGPVFGMPLPDGTRVLLGFDHWPGDGGYTILHGIDGTMERDSPVKKLTRTFTENNTPVALEISVRRMGNVISIVANRNGEKVISWEGEATRLSPADFWFSSDKRRLTISQYNGMFTFDELQVTPVTGKIVFSDPRPYRNNSDREVAEWVVSSGGRVAIRSASQNSVVSTQRLSELPEEPFSVIRISGLNDRTIPSDWFQAVGRLDHLQELDLNQSYFDNADLRHLADAQSLLRVTCWDSALNDDGLSAIASLRRLEEVSVSDAKVTTDGLGALSNHSSLRSLAARVGPAGDAAAEVAATLPRLQQLRLGSSDVTSKGLAALQGHAALEGLYLNDCRMLDIDDIDLLATLPAIHVVDLSNNDFGPDVCERLIEISSLLRIRLFGNPIGDKGIADLVHLGSLRELSLGATGVTDESLPLIAKLEQLEHLGLTGNRGVTDASLDSLKSLGRLKQLHLKGTSVSASGVRQLKQTLRGCEISSNFDPASVRKLDLRNRGVTDETLPLALEGNVPISELTLEGKGITDQSLELIASLPKLKRVDFHNSSVTNEGVALLSTSDSLERVEFWNMPQITGDVTTHLASIPNLKAVTFKSTGVYGPGLERFHGKGLRAFHIGSGKVDGAMLKQYIVPLGHLDSLDLAGAAIIDDDVAAIVPMQVGRWLHLGFNRRIQGPGLAAIAEMPQVESLMLDASGVDDEGLKHLISAADQLTSLTIRETSLTDASVETLGQFKNLRQLDLTNTKFSGTGIDKLRESLPNTNIVADHLKQMTSVYPPANSAMLVGAKGWKPSWAPDGKRLVYGLAAGEGLEIIDRETGETRKIDVRGKDPMWSPRGDWIAFVHEPFYGSGKVEVWIVKPDGTDATSISRRATYPFWIDGGQQLIYYSLDTRTLMSVNVDADSGQPTKFVDVSSVPKIPGAEENGGFPSYYADATDDGTFVAYAYQGKLVVVDRASGESSFTHDFGTGEGTGLVEFSPDNRFLALAFFTGKQQGIWLFDWRSGEHVQRVEGDYCTPTWSPDGKELAFDYRRLSSSDQQEIWIGKVEFGE